MKFDPLEIFFQFLRYAVVIVVIVIIFVFTFSFRLNISTDKIERTGLQIAEALLSSPYMTSSRAVFDKEKINGIIKVANERFHSDGKNLEEEPNIEPEWVARECRYAYKASIKDLADNTEQVFGFEPQYGIFAKDEIINQESYFFDAGISVKNSLGKEYVRPARLKIDIVETWFTRIGCMIEEAYEFRENRSIMIPCLYEERIAEITGEYSSKVKNFCGFRVKKSSDNGYHICLYKQKKDRTIGELEPVVCRYFPKKINIIFSPWIYPKERETQTLKIYPLEEELDSEMKESQIKELCKELRKEGKSSAGEVKSVLLCIE